MAAYDLMSKLERLDFLIRRKATGKSKELAGKLGISERQVFNYLSLLKDLDAPVNYCHQRETYYYEKEGKFAFRFKALSEEEKRETAGGGRILQSFFTTALTLQRCHLLSRC